MKQSMPEQTRPATHESIYPLRRYAKVFFWGGSTRRRRERI